MGGQTTKQKLKAAGVDASQENNVVHLRPSEIRVDMRDNVRKPFYTVGEVLPEIADWSEVGDAMCFSRAEIEKRLASFLKTSPRGQAQECVVYLTTSGHPVLSDGYLRWSAMALAEATGVLDKIKGASKGLRCIVVPAAGKKSGTQLDYELGRLASNEETLPMTAIDRGYCYTRIIKADGLTPAELAERLDVEVNTINTNIRLTNAKLRIQLELREGRMTKTAVLKLLSKSGEGGASGPTGARAGVKQSLTKNFLRAVRDQDHAKKLLASDAVFTTSDVRDLLALLVGEENVKPSKQVKAIIAAITEAPPKPRAVRGRPKKKMAPKPGETKNAK